MARVETLNEIAQLERSGFGRPPPRHGLKLLYWFAKECVTFDENNEMVSQCNPEDEECGFHYFENRYERNGTKLLPDVNFPYYVVGNLNSKGEEDLPDYICEEYTGLQDDSNTDRIIVSLDDKYFDKVYITTHTDGSNYDPDNTYRITKGLLQHISQLSLDTFLHKTGYYKKSWGRTSPLNTHYRLPTSMRINYVAVALPANPPVPPRQQECQIELQSKLSNNDAQGQRKNICSCTIL